jgi:hypothetical protein
VEVLSTLIFAESYDFGLAIVISFDVESPVDSPIQDLNYSRELGFKSRTGLKRLLEISNTYGIPFTLFCRGHALLKECRGHKTIIKIVRRNRRYCFHAGEYLWHAINPASNYVEYPEFYYGDLIDEAIRSGIGHEIASHSFSHIPYPLVDDNTADKDLNMSIEALQLYGLKPYSFAFPFGLVGKMHNLLKHGIKIVRIGHRSIKNISYNNGLVIVKSDITDFSIDSLRWWIKITDLLVKRRTLLSWYLHPATLYNDKAYKIFEEIIKILIKRRSIS